MLYYVPARKGARHVWQVGPACLAGPGGCKGPARQAGPTNPFQRGAAYPALKAAFSVVMRTWYAPDEALFHGLGTIWR